MLRKALILSTLLFASSVNAATVAQWTFETSVPTTSGTFAPEVGSGSALGSHVSTSVVYSNPVGNGSVESFSSNNWSVGDFYQFSVSTLGFSGVTLSWDQISSATGPRDFSLSYSLNGTSFTNYANYSVIANSTPNAWSSSTPVSTSSYAYDLSSITALNNQSNVFFRLVDVSTVSANGGTVATAGTDRVDNFTVSAVASVPEADTYAMLLAGMGLMGFVLRRRNQS
ncbi:MAG: PEP-CTERM sorting domain-containing protein [Methylophilus sp.]|nr:PEP-CTERM sorting domain-containing protein [Methylophilus sp.]